MIDSVQSARGRRREQVFLILLVKVFEVQVDSVSHSTPEDEGEEQGIGRARALCRSPVSVVQGGWLESERSPIVQGSSLLAVKNSVTVHFLYFKSSPNYH